MVTLIPMEEKHIQQCSEIDTNSLLKPLDDCSDILSDIVENLKEFRGNAIYTYFQGFINHTGRYAYCIIADEQIVGYITALEMPDKSCGTNIYIDEIRIADNEQKKGYGTNALEQFFSLFNDEQMFSLITQKNLPAYHMYQKLSFNDTGNVQLMTRSVFSDLIRKMKKD